MGIIFSVLYFIIIIVIIFTVVNAAKSGKFFQDYKNGMVSGFNSPGNYSSPGSSKKRGDSVNAEHEAEHVRLAGKKNKMPSKGAHPFFKADKSRPSGTLFEDRQHDWLARQLKEEANALKRSDFTDLGAKHDAHCDARAIKLMHMLQHDDSIDTGES